MVNLRFEKKHKVAIAAALFLLSIDALVFFGSALFIPLIAVAVTVGWLPYWTDIFAENRKQKELETKFPEFVRNLTGAIKSGMPASQAVIQVADTDYGALTPYVKKLANQLEWSLPFHQAFQNFGQETNNGVIKRAIATMSQAEEAGGNVEDVLSAITESLLQIKKIREERRASIHAQVLQSYIIFFVFLGVMIIIQNLLIPYMSEFSTGLDEGIGIGVGINTKVPLDFSDPFAFVSSIGGWALSIYGIFLMMSMIQGFFAGVVLGKLAEGDLTSGLKHSLIMATSAFIIITFAQGFT
ncbi:type II secretion system F family protein [Candidatus Woesearchaeota archaeon]|nr:type II secretion system F family protein [Candidatus Woesearchaeota archaeon]